MADKYRVAHLDEVPVPVRPDPGSYTWRPIRHHLGVRAFGVNANQAAAGDWVVEEHTETGTSGTRHEELYYVARGHARFVVDGEEVDAPEGTLVLVPDPAATRSARAVAADTTVLAIGGEPGAAYRVSPWEKKYFPGDATDG